MIIMEEKVMINNGNNLMASDVINNKRAAKNRAKYNLSLVVRFLKACGILVKDAGIQILSWIFDLAIIIWNSEIFLSILT